MTPSFKITHQKRINKNTLIGVFDLELPSRLKINGFMLLEKNGKRWFGFPSREWVKPDGARSYSPLLELASRELADRFQGTGAPVNDAQRQALRAAAALGYPCFPCFPDKRPACPRGFKDAALREAGLATLWTRHPGELIGVPTGSVSGVAVLDVDRDKGGGEWWAANKTRLPSTRLHRTRSGGLHCVFRHRPGLRCSASQIAPGVDVR